MPSGGEAAIAALATGVKYLGGSAGAVTYAAPITTSGVTATPTFSQGSNAYTGSAVGTLSTLGLAGASSACEWTLKSQSP